MIRRGTHVTPWLAVCAVVALLYLLSSCSTDSATTDSPAIDSAAERPIAAVVPSADETDDRPVLPPSGMPATLSEWGQLVISNGQVHLAAGVEPYTLNSALFSDYAHKLRTVWIPEGAAPAAYNETTVFDFPVGTVITKTFYFPTDDASVGSEGPPRLAKRAPVNGQISLPLELESVHVIETRVLVHRDDGWHALPYVWNAQQTEATLARVGDLQMLTLVDESTESSFPYVVPNVNQCANCHAVNHTSGDIEPIGPKARHLNLEADLGGRVVSQLDYWQERGLLASGLPSDVPRSAAWNDPDATLDARARAYLDVNCAHCHNQVGPADTSGLFLEPTTDLGPSLGICKLPIAAGTGTGGRRVGIHPGEPDQSIFVYRMETEDPGAMMPELGRALVHTEGVALISDWIGSLDGDC